MAKIKKTTRKELILASLASAKRASFSPVQVQKLFFLIEQNIPDLVNGPHFTFVPYNYGPFDKEVYKELNALIEKGYVETFPDRTWNKYRLTEQGQEKGDQLYASLDKVAQSYIKEVSTFVRNLTFTQLLSSIYKAYPEMRANSVFQD